MLASRPGLLPRRQPKTSGERPNLRKPAVPACSRGGSPRRQARRLTYVSQPSRLAPEAAAQDVRRDAALTGRVRPGLADFYWVLVPGGQHYSETCFTAHHPLIRFWGFFQRIDFVHGPDAGKNAESKGILRIDGHPGIPTLDRLAAH